MNPHLLSIACCLCLLVACQKSDRLQVALTHAGENRMELEKVLHYYEDDTLKLRAAKFLIENMPYHFSVMETMVCPEGKEYYPDITRFDGKDRVVESYQSTDFGRTYALEQVIRRIPGELNAKAWRPIVPIHAQDNMPVYWHEGRYAGHTGGWHSDIVAYIEYDD